MKTESGLADDSIINDSDESSFGYFGRTSSQEESIIKTEYMKNYDKELCIQKAKPGFE